LSLNIPGIFSVDDHVVESPTIWSDRLPAKYAGVGPRVVREKVGTMEYIGGVLEFGPAEEGRIADVWHYEDKWVPLYMTSAAVGYDITTAIEMPLTFDEIRKGCYDPAARIEDMDVSGVYASLCFPNNSLVRFCGQVFKEASDKDLALLCVRAYNDWMVDEWCAGSGGRLVPLCIVPLWDPVLAAEEIRRNAARGVRAVTFSEMPAFLDLPSPHTDHWNPFFQACQETGTVICLHIGSGSRVGTGSPDAPMGVTLSLTFLTAAQALADWLLSGVFERFPQLRVCMAECQIGWIPYLLERLDSIWERRGFTRVGDDRLRRPPRDYFRDHILVSFFDDLYGAQSYAQIGEDNIAFETDYPHQDSNWPNSLKVGESQTEGLPAEVRSKLLYGNAARWFGL